MRNLSQTPQGGSFYGIHDDIFNFSFFNNILFLFALQKKKHAKLNYVFHMLFFVKQSFFYDS